MCYIADGGGNEVWGASGGGGSGAAAAAAVAGAMGSYPYPSPSMMGPSSHLTQPHYMATHLHDPMVSMVRESACTLALFHGNSPL